MRCDLCGYGGGIMTVKFATGDPTPMQLCSECQKKEGRRRAEEAQRNAE